MQERVALAGVEASIGIAVLGAFLVLGVLAVVGVGVLLVTGQVAATAGGVATYAGSTIVVALWARLVVRDLRAVRVVAIEADGGWRLVGPLGIPRGTIPAGAPRTVRRHAADTWIFGVVRRYTQTWAELESGGRRWATCRGTPTSNGKALAHLETLAKSGQESLGIHVIS